MKHYIRASSADLHSERLHTILEDGEFVLYRQRDPTDTRSLLVVVPRSEHPRPQAVRMLEHEHTLRGDLDPAWALRPVALTTLEGRPALVLEDPGGELILQRAGRPMDIADVLRVGVGVAAALRQLHGGGLIHKDIKPANVMMDWGTGRVWLRGFGIASRLPRERRPPEPPEFIAGTLAYMAPEQTGWMNRSIDARSDLYALGVVIYELVTGSLPFTASDPMACVHAHIARRPVPPAERRPGIPDVVSAIVMKLLAKTAEDRYQTAAAVERDLRRCLAQWEAEQRIDAFALAEDDTPDRLVIPETLYGRAREIDTLLGAFERVVTSGTPELMLVSGYAGIGKSSVVNELHKVLLPPRGLFASGKFDQYKRDIPYATLAQAFQSLIRNLLGKSEPELDTWRAALRQALEPNGRLMVDLVPALTLLMGDQPPVPELAPQDAQRRFQLVFRRFIGVFARPDRPLVLFLDDLQWLDAGTLAVLEDLLTQRDVPHVLLIGAYRDHEVDAAHPLRRTLDRIRASGARVQEISLLPLASHDVGQLLADALRCTPARVAPLAQLVHDKTAGNPFFAMQFIGALADDGLLTFDHGQGCWVWDVDRIYAKAYTDNVVDLVVGKLHRLPVDTQAALQQLACLGNTAALSTLALVRGTSEEAVHADLWEAVRHEVVERLEGAYAFIHDRVQEAAYSLIPEERRAAAHLRIGRLLATHTPPQKREEAIFEIVNQLNRGAALITQPEEREQLAELNLIAGTRAKNSTAYTSALTYLLAGAALLTEDCWGRQHALAFSLQFHRAACEFLTGAPAAAEERLSALSTRAVTAVEHATVACLRLDVHLMLGQSGRAIAVGLDYLRRVGIDWSPHPTDEDVQREYDRIWAQLGDRTIEELIELPLMSDPVAHATLDVLTRLFGIAAVTNLNLECLTICKAVNLSLERGNSDGSCCFYALLGSLAGPQFGNYQAGVRFGQLSYDLIERRELRRFQALTYLIWGHAILPLTRQVRASHGMLRRAFEVAIKTGDLTCAGFCCFQLNAQLLADGEPLADIQREAENGLAFAREIQFQLVIQIISGQLGLIRTLRGLTRTLGVLDRDQFDELPIEQRLADNPARSVPSDYKGHAPVVVGHWIRTLQARYLAGDCAAAVEAASQVDQLPERSIQAVEWHFYGALSHAACCDSTTTADQRQPHVEAMAAHHRPLAIRAEVSPEHFEHRAALVGAELARVEGREFEALRLYERAIHAARANGFVHHEALAHELAGRFYLQRGFETASAAHLGHARACYALWGADGKVRQLDGLYPHLRPTEPGPDARRTIESPVEHLELTTVLNVSQAVSGELVLDKLVETLLRTAIEHAGAERGVLIAPRGEALWVRAEGRTTGSAIPIVLRDVPFDGAALPESVVRYAARVHETVNLDDASTHGGFSNDEYICREHAKSVLCLPLLQQGRLMAVLYLENNLAAGIFTPARMAVLNVLAAQAAMSLEKSRLFHELQQREAKIRRLVEANIIGIFTYELDGRIIDANDALLRIVGYDRDDLVSGRLRWTDLTPPEWLERDRGMQVPQLETFGTIQPIEKEYFRKDGSRVPVLVGGANIEENEGVAFVLDLTERKQAEERTAKLAAIVESSDDAIISKDLNGIITTWNSGAERIFGYAAREVIGQSVTILAPPDRVDEVRGIMERIRRGERVDHFETVRRRKDGTLLDISLSVSPIIDGNGNVVGASKVARDISERKHAEETLREKDAALETARTELARMSRVTTLGELTTSIAHEVAQPLGGMITSAGACTRWLAAEPPDLAEARSALDNITADGKRAREVIARIRALTKRQTPRKEKLDVNQEVLGVLALTERELRGHDIVLLTQLARMLPRVAGDRVQLQQVLINLIMNAIEAMSGVRDRPRELTIVARQEGSNAVLVEVRDSGHGLDPQRAEQVFEAFYTTKAEGIGIGLSISRSIVEAHGGRLWAAPNEPHGAVFRISLPVTEEALS